MASLLTSIRHLFRRRTYVIDRPMQFGAAAQLLVGLGLVGLLFAVGLFVFLGDDAMASMNIVTIREFLLMANAIYFVLAAVILAALTLLLTHRFAGPAYVLDRAVQGMIKGDYGRRLALRKRDYLKDLAAALDSLRTQWIQHDEQSHQALDELQHCLEEKRFDDAEKILTRLRESRLVRSETVSRKSHDSVSRPRTKEPVAV